MSDRLSGYMEEAYGLLGKVFYEGEDYVLFLMTLRTIIDTTLAGAISNITVDEEDDIDG